jgi:hypothetical protein
MARFNSLFTQKSMLAGPERPVPSTNPRYPLPRVGTDASLLLGSPGSEPAHRPMRPSGFGGAACAPTCCTSCGRQSPIANTLVKSRLMAANPWVHSCLLDLIVDLLTASNVLMALASSCVATSHSHTYAKVQPRESRVLQLRSSYNYLKNDQNTLKKTNIDREALASLQ